MLEAVKRDQTNRYMQEVKDDVASSGADLVMRQFTEERQTCDDYKYKHLVNKVSTIGPVIVIRERYIVIYIYIYIEREIYIYIYIYIV